MAETFTPATLTNINGQVTSAVTSINANFAAIATLLQDVLSIEGNAPNQMQSNLDLNGKRLLNVAAPSYPTDVVRLEDLQATALPSINFGLLRVINMITMGADPTGTIDIQTTAWPAALALAASFPLGVWFYFPAGTYISSKSLTYGSTHVKISGDGGGLSAIRFTNNTAGQAGVVITQNSQIWKTFISDISFLTFVNQPNNVGVTVNYPVAASGALPSLLMQDVEIASDGSNDYYWQTGVSLGYCWAGTIRSCSIRGANVLSGTGVTSGSNMQYGIAFYGFELTTGGGSQSFVIDNTAIYFAVNAVYNTGDNEGMVISNSVFVAVNIGVNAPDGQNFPGLFISDTHINAFLGAVVVGGWQQMIISDCVFFKNPASTENWNGVFIGSGPNNIGDFYSQFKDNTLVGFFGSSAGGTATAFAFDANSTVNLVDGNIAMFCDYFASGGGGATVNYFTNNRAFQMNPSGAWFNNAPASWISNGNLPQQVGVDIGFGVLTLNSTTPNVGGSQSSVWKTNNNTATSVSNFTNGYPGQIIYIIANDANTTLAHSTSIVLSGTADYVMSLANTVSLLNVAGKWHEQSRS